MSRVPDTRWIDIALKVTVPLAVVAIAYLAYTVLSEQSRERQNATATQAVGDLIASIRENPNDLGLRLALADAYAAAGQVPEAVEQFEVVLQLDENNPDALTGLGLIAMFEGEWKDAEDYWRRVVEEIGAGQYAGLDQRLAVAYHQLGVTLIELGKYEDAIKALEEALRIRRTAADTQYAISVAYRELDAPAEQREHLERALMFDPVMPEANYDLGLLLLAEGDVAGAAEHFRVSADNAPEGVTKPMDELAALGESSARLAEAKQAAKSDPAAALLDARVAHALDPDSRDAAKLVARLYQRTGDLASAEKAWQRVLVQWPGEAEATAALERLERQD